MLLKTKQALEVLQEVAAYMAAEAEAGEQKHKDCDYLRGKYAGIAVSHKFYSEKLAEILKEAGENE